MVDRVMSRRLLHSLLNSYQVLGKESHLSIEPSCKGINSSLEVDWDGPVDPQQGHPLSLSWPMVDRR